MLLGMFLDASIHCACCQWVPESGSCTIAMVRTYALDKPDGRRNRTYDGELRRATKQSWRKVWKSTPRGRVVVVLG
jgi:hypothetical protein